MRSDAPAPGSSAGAAAWTDLGGGVSVRQSRVYRMNSVLLDDPAHAVLVDPGVTPSELDDIAGRVGPRPADAVTLFLTHADWDHVLGRSWWPGARVIAHDGTAAALHEGREAILAEARAAAEAEGESWTRGFEAFRPQHPVRGLHVTDAGPWHLVLRDAPGHSPTMLNLHVPQRRLLVAGDLLSDIEIPALCEPAARCRRALEELMPIVAHDVIEFLVPGHGAIAIGPDAVRRRFEADIAYLAALERGARETRAAGIPIEEAAARIPVGPHPAADMPETAGHHRANVRLEYGAAGGAS